MRRIRTVIVDDKRPYRVAIQTALAAYAEVEVVGTFGDGLDVVEAASGRDGPPWDVVLMDVEMPRMDGIEATRRLKAISPDLPIVILTVFEEPNVVLRAICAGADGYLLKDTVPEELMRHLRVATTGGSPLTPAVAGAMLDVVRQLHGKGPGIEVALSRREQQVLEQLVRGLSYKQVGAELGIGIETVRTYVRSLYKKLQVHSVAEAVSLALRHRLV